MDLGQIITSQCMDLLGEHTLVVLISPTVAHIDASYFKDCETDEIYEGELCEHDGHAEDHLDNCKVTTVYNPYYWYPYQVKMFDNYGDDDYADVYEQKCRHKDCPKECADHWEGDGICDEMCRECEHFWDSTATSIFGSTDFEFDGGDCHCADNCPESWIGDGICDYGGNYIDCAGCAHMYTYTLTEDGYGFEVNFDGGDCDVECPEGSHDHQWMGEWSGQCYCDETEEPTTDGSNCPAACKYKVLKPLESEYCPVCYGYASLYEDEGNNPSFPSYDFDCALKQCPMDADVSEWEEWDMCEADASNWMDHPFYSTALYAHEGQCDGCMTKDGEWPKGLKNIDNCYNAFDVYEVTCASCMDDDKTIKDMLNQDSWFDGENDCHDFIRHGGINGQDVCSGTLLEGLQSIFWFGDEMTVPDVNTREVCECACKLEKKCYQFADAWPHMVPEEECLDGAEMFTLGCGDAWCITNTSCSFDDFHFTEEDLAQCNGCPIECHDGWVGDFVCDTVCEPCEEFWDDNKVFDGGDCPYETADCEKVLVPIDSADCWYGPWEVAHHTSTSGYFYNTNYNYVNLTADKFKDCEDVDMKKDFTGTVCEHDGFVEDYLDNCSHTSRSITGTGGFFSTYRSVTHEYFFDDHSHDYADIYRLECVAPDTCVDCVDQGRAWENGQCNNAMFCDSFYFTSDCATDLEGCKELAEREDAAKICPTAGSCMDCMEVHELCHWDSFSGFCEVEDNGFLPTWWTDFVNEPEFCPENCPNNMEWMPCASSCDPTCSEPEPPMFCNLMCEVRCGCPSDKITDWMGEKCVDDVSECESVVIEPESTKYWVAEGCSTDGVQNLPDVGWAKTTKKRGAACCGEDTMGQKHCTTKDDLDAGCESKLTWTDAANYCANNGLRLCTREEIEEDN
eukprot:UN06612